MPGLPDLTPIRAIYPFAQHWFELPAGRMQYVDEGSGPPVVLLHGNPSWSFYYRRLIPALSPFFRVIAPDHLGCGLSDKPQQYPYRLADHSANLAALLAHLGITETSMVLHDWGGPIGLGCVTSGAVRLRRLALLNTAAFLSPRIPLRIAVCKIPGFGDLAVRGLNGFAVGATLMAVERPLSPLVRRGYLLPYDSFANRIATLRFVQDIPLAPTHPSWATVRAIEERLPMLSETPVQIVWGGRDWCFNDHFLAGWIERLPHAHVQRLDDAGHYVLEDAPERVIPLVVEFLCREKSS